MSNVRVTNIHENEVEWRSEQEAWNNRSEFLWNYMTNKNVLRKLRIL